MKIVKKNFRKIKTTLSDYFIVLSKFLIVCKIILFSLIYKRKIYLFGIPIHGNLGDQAILVAELKFLQDHFKGYKVIEIESEIAFKHCDFLKILVGNSIILVNGGGFLGTLWLNEEQMFREVIINFPNNRIVVFPQTIYFSTEDDEELNRSRNIYNQHKNLYICCREKYSYQFMKDNQFKCHILLIPDMVLYLDTIDSYFEKKDVLYCIRNDKEKLSHDYKKLNEIFIKANNFKINQTDTVVPNSIFKYNREKILYKKMYQFSRYKLVVTDRLHGMIFSLLVGTPCLVFENKSYKVRGVYEWIKDSNIICLADQKNINKDVEQLLAVRDNNYDHQKLKKSYVPLVKVIRQGLKENK